MKSVFQTRSAMLAFIASQNKSSTLHMGQRASSRSKLIQLAIQTQSALIGLCATKGSA